MAQDDKGKKLRRSCVESFVGLSDELKAQLYQCVLLINDAYETIYDPSDLNRVVEDVCIRIMKECSKLGALCGLFTDINMFNLFCFFRASRMRTKGAAGYNVPCAEASQGIIRILTERILFCTEKAFLTAACSGVSLPPAICKLLHEIYTEMKAKCLGAWRRLVCNRRPIMILTSSLLKLYNTYDTAGLLSEQSRALCLLVFQPVYLPRIMAPLEIMTKGQLAPENFYSITGSAEKRRPITTGKVTGLSYPGSGLMPESLILPILEPGLLPASMVDLSDVLAKPAVILSAPALSQFVISKPHPNMPHTVSIIPFNPSGTDPAFISTWQAASQNMVYNTSTAPLKPATGSSQTVSVKAVAQGAVITATTVPQAMPARGTGGELPVMSASTPARDQVAACFVAENTGDSPDNPSSFLTSCHPCDPNTVIVAQQFQPPQCVTLLQVTCAPSSTPPPDSTVRAPVVQLPTVVPLPASAFLPALAQPEASGEELPGGHDGDQGVPCRDSTAAATAAEATTPKRKQRSKERSSKKRKALTVPEADTTPSTTTPGTSLGSITTPQDVHATDVATSEGPSEAQPPLLSLPPPLDVDQSLFALLDEAGPETWDVGSPLSPTDDALLSSILQGLYQLDTPPPLRSPSPASFGPESPADIPSPSGGEYTQLQPVRATSATPANEVQESGTLYQLHQWRNYFRD
ncbi:ORF50 [Human gammaherpesvirus 8]|uniref:Replication and transcription activator n=5 Tax=Human herpesvirus 8 TaxID=37296 RepID=ORF50_HHV8P|nr:ORF50 [Human gammaherpesvirus 8]F5HCV3.1 RecName: Full=Putative transcription activator ORF50 [Human herpesvirus 8 strain GK18]ANI86093.1 ORF50 [synthetic construct]AAC34946.1 unknown [Human gammaherpesvirus 8]AAD25315.1 transcription activator ORF50 [Human gammaherpesvirus 8]AAD25318.1 transcription activator ORF50 [Human gammaherpesvirus 8]AAD25321.1 transcription activator ORF50 [Human gammaherpesvirus 8]